MVRFHERSGVQKLSRNSAEIQRIRENPAGKNFTVAHNQIQGFGSAFLDQMDAMQKILQPLEILLYAVQALFKTILSYQRFDGLQMTFFKGAVQLGVCPVIAGAAMRHVDQ